MEVILNINNLKYLDIFNDLSIYIEKNTITTISGKNNCGKTTLFRLLDRQIITDSNIILNTENIYDYKIDEYSMLVKTIIPNEFYFREKIVEDELYSVIDEYDKNKFEMIENLIKKFGIKKYLKKEISTLSTGEKILISIVRDLINKPELLLLDNIDIFFNNIEMKNILKNIREYIKEYGLTVLLTTLNLDISLDTDELYIIDNGRVSLHGTPITILQKDNVINKIGLSIPFMIDLSVKLRDYDLIESIELDMNRMIEQLWK